MKTAKSAAKKTTKGAKATPTKGKKAKVAAAIRIEATPETSLPFETATSDPTLVAATAAIESASKATKKNGKPKTAKPSKPAAKLGVLGAAHQVLAAAGTRMTSQEMIAAMAEQKLWSSPNGKTPAQTLYAAIIREIGRKGADTRFIKTERGKFEAKVGA